MQLGELQNILGSIKELGFELIGVSADRVAATMDSVKELKLDFPLYSDAKMEVANALGIAFRLDTKTFETLKEYGLDVETASGHTHHILPVPGVFVIVGGVIRYMHINPDHTHRLPGAVLLAMLESLKEDL